MAEVGDQALRRASGEQANDNVYEYLAIVFSGDRVPPDLVNALVEVVDYETVHISDIVFVTRQTNGDIAVMEIDDLDDELQELFCDLEGEYDGLLSDNDTTLLAQYLAPGQTTVAIVWEDLRARRFRDAVRKAGGHLLVHDRVPRGAVARALAPLVQESAP